MLEDGESKIKMLVDLVSGEACFLLPRWHLAVVYPRVALVYMTTFVCVVPSSPFYKTLIPFVGSKPP